MNGTFKRPCGIFIFFLLITTFLISGCPGGAENDDALVITILDEREDIEPESGELTILCWPEYIPLHIVRDFENEYGIPVIIESLEEIVDTGESLIRNPEEYDLIIMDDFQILHLRELGLLAPLDKKNIPNMALIDPLFIFSPYDEGREYSVPFMWGTMGVSVNRAYVTEKTIDWDILFDSTYSGKIDMLDWPYVNTAPALKKLGYSINERDPEVLAEVEELLLQQMDIAHGYLPGDQIIENLADTTVYVAYTFSWEGLTAGDLNEDIEYLIPESGAPLWVDSWVISSRSENRSAAEAFMNFVLTPEIIADISNNLWDVNTVPESWQYLDDEIVETEGLFPPDDVLKRCEFLIPPDMQYEAFLDELWELIHEP
jgi:spermidine/putrescine transport system substrate-binding protein